MAELAIALGAGAKTAAIVGNVATAASIGGTALQAIGAIQQGRAADVSAKFEAKQIEQNAKQREAIAQREAIVRAQKIRESQNQYILRNAAGGVSMTSPSVAQILGGFEEDINYERSVALYQGAEEATGMRTQAQATRIAGKQARSSGLTSGVSSLVGGTVRAATLADKYGIF